ncbi:MAG: hypothetical protein IT384_07220 [Deltaproteobacteria bacterium]|nr:hypothetical protein [Deltaproteobacteria bacterium]
MNARTSRGLARGTALLLLALGASSCSVTIPSGVFGCASSADCPEGFVCKADRLCWDGAEASDASAGEDSGARSDAAGGDADVRADASPGADRPVASDVDPTADATPGSDLVLGSDAQPEDGDAQPEDGDAGPEDGDAGPADVFIPDFGPNCSPLAGQLCTDNGTCGGRYDCDGVCMGGTAAPACGCGPASCSVGQWQCPDPANYGASCSDATRCGGAIDCAGACVGGNPLPSCPCGPPTCEPSGQWSACPGPSNYDAPCETPTICGGRINCGGDCAGGSPMPACPECGSPTCNGCVGGMCSASSACSPEGRCVCTVNNCNCGGGGGVSGCSYCLSGSVGSCTMDAYSCGSFTPQLSCDYGCVDGPNNVCECAPGTGGYCPAGFCNCSCGRIPRDGTLRCDGTCVPDLSCTLECATVCCGQFLC